MDHILENNDNPVPDLKTQASSAPRTSAPSAMALDDEDEDDAAAIRAALGKESANIAPASGSEVSAEAGEAKVRLPFSFLTVRITETIVQSIKCTQCGKVFKNVDLANYHAEKSGHDQFEESTDEVRAFRESDDQSRTSYANRSNLSRRTKRSKSLKNCAPRWQRRRPEKRLKMRKKIKQTNYYEERPGRYKSL